MGERESSAVRYFESLIERGRFEEEIIAAGCSPGRLRDVQPRKRRRSKRVSQAIAFVRAGGSTKDAAERYGVSREYLRDVLRGERAQ